MAYYNRDCKKLKLALETMEFLNSGNCAKVLHNSDIIFKIYFSSTEIHGRLKPDVFNLLKDINNAHFIKLYDIYSDMNLLELIYYKINKKAFTTDAYSGKYYVEDPINVLYENIDYILDNFRELELLFQIFTENQILTNDVRRKNSVLTQNGIIIIDPDMYSITENPKSTVAIANKTRLLNLLESIFIDGLITTNQANNSRMMMKIGYYDLINIEINENTDVTYEISKKLKPFKKPIDYLKNE